MSTTLSTLSFELKTCIAQYLSWKDLYHFSQCNKTFYGLQYVDSLWKAYCRAEFGIRYNHPNQTYKDLFLACCRSTTSFIKRLPCNHISDMTYPNRLAVMETQQCQHCTTIGSENLFICIEDHQTMCDRHTRQHTRLNNAHCVFYKMNTSELFCQICVDWIGGMESNPAEQYVAEKLSLQWTDGDQNMNEMRRIRQRERRQRWQDTPQYIMKSDFCFISSTWMAEWEMFVEGWQTHRPERVIDQHGLLTSIMSLNRVGTNPFYLNSNDLVMIISGQTWDYLVREYGLRGEKISQEDLVPEENYLKIIHRIAYWKKRAGACS